MAATLLTLGLAAVIFIWVFAPLFAKAGEIPQVRSSADIEEAVSKSIQELNTDLELHKIQQEDLDHIRAFLEQESAK